MVGFKPTASAGHGGVERAKEDDADYGLEGARGEFLGAGDEISGRVVDENIERAVFPDGVDRGLDGFEIADITRQGVDGAVDAEFRGGLLENFYTTAADVDSGAEFEKALRHGFAEAGAAAGDEGAFVSEEI